MLAQDKWPIFSYQDFKLAEMQILDKNREFISVSLAILTVSDSRTFQNDKSGDYLEKSVFQGWANM